MDVVFSQEATILAQVSSLMPGFGFFREDGRGNAFATPELLLGRGDGTVIFGIALVNEQIRSVRWWGAAIAGIMAHEWCHIAQFQSGRFSPGRGAELHADFVAGWYMGFKQATGIAVVQISGLAESLFSKGDYNFNSRDHHGTPKERVRSMARGFELAVRDRVGDFGTAFRAYRG
jgi:hypothetical protein